MDELSRPGQSVCRFPLKFIQINGLPRNNNKKSRTGAECGVSIWNFMLSLILNMARRIGLGNKKHRPADKGLKFGILCKWNRSMAGQGRMTRGDA
ncbi:hypothetical protein [Janthinobacterium psychrotolerans]|uniref:hypothetical protein n=1 Tax=Janthinobacterium psychrotolerans TaxID=1747903 RepID=UPI0012372A1C|nr:hypothetical protein [Janthinobacterium psychrotolerans]